MEKFDYTIATTKNVDEAVAAIEAKSKEKVFSVLHIHDVSYQFAIRNVTFLTVVIARASSPKQSLTTEIASSFHSSQ